MDVDVAIVGAGPAGLSLARALSDGGLTIRIVDQQSLDTLRDPPFDGREIALTPRSQRIMQSLRQWQHLEPADISPLRSARVRDGESAHALRITPQRGGDDRLGCLVPNHRIRRAAYRAIEDDRRVTLSTDVLARPSTRPMITPRCIFPMARAWVHDWSWLPTAASRPCAAPPASAPACATSARA